MTFKALGGQIQQRKFFRNIKKGLICVLTGEKPPRPETSIFQLWQSLEVFV